MNRLAIINPHNVPLEETADYTRRLAARGVVIDQDGNLGLLNVTKKDYYKLPGGGIEPNETPEEAFIRECLEEIGCQVSITGELGYTDEYNPDSGKFQTSYGFMGEVQGSKQRPRYEADEVDSGFQVEWLNPDAAIHQLRNQNVHAIMNSRDLLFAKTALGVS